MKKNVLILTIIISLVSLFLLFPKKQVDAIAEKELSLWILSDPHFLSPDLYDDGSAFELMQKTAAGKELLHQEDSWQSFVHQAKKEQPDVVVVTGDLTFNGEKQSAERLQQFFSELEAEGIAVLVIPGNHDIHDGWARKFVGDEQFTTEQISPKDFQKIFSSSYDLAIEKDPHSLSYIVQATNDIQLFLLDTNIYTIETSKRQPTTGGKIADASMQWLEEQLEKAKNEQQTPLIFMHHNLLKHNTLVYKGYVLANADELQQLLTTYRVPLVFSGHIHAQDILQGAEDTIEITTGSFSIAPQIIGELQLSANDWRYQRQTLDSSNQPIPDDANSYAEYMEQLFITDGQQLAYRSFIEAGIYDETILDPIAELVGTTNFNFFSGNDDLTEEELQKEQQTEGYQLLEQQGNSFLLDYVQSIIQDTNLPDDYLHLKKRDSWQIISTP